MMARKREIEARYALESFAEESSLENIQVKAHSWRSMISSAENHFRTAKLSSDIKKSKASYRAIKRASIVFVQL